MDGECCTRLKKEKPCSGLNPSKARAAGSGTKPRIRTVRPVEDETSRVPCLGHMSGISGSIVLAVRSPTYRTRCLRPRDSLHPRWPRTFDLLPRRVVVFPITILFLRFIHLPRHSVCASLPRGFAEREYCRVPSVGNGALVIAGGSHLLRADGLHGSGNTRRKRFGDLPVGYRPNPRLASHYEAAPSA